MSEGGGGGAEVFIPPQPSEASIVEPIIESSRSPVLEESTKPKIITEKTNTSRSTNDGSSSSEELDTEDIPTKPVTEVSTKIPIDEASDNPSTNESSSGLPEPKTETTKTPEQKLQEARNVLIRASSVFVKKLKLESPEIIDKMTDKVENPQENVLAVLFVLGSEEMPPTVFEGDGVSITVNEEPLEIHLSNAESEVIQAVSLLEIKDDGTAIIKLSNGEIKKDVPRSDLVNAELRAEGEKLDTGDSLTESQKEVSKDLREALLKGASTVNLARLEAHIDTSNEELDKVEEEIDEPPSFEESANLLKFREHQENLRGFLQDLTDKYETESDPERKKDLLKTIRVVKQDYDENEKALTNISRKRNIRQWEKDIVEISESTDPELVKLRRKIEEALILPGGVAEAIKLVAAKYGVKLDPTIIEKYGKTAGKVSLLAALGLMYALMKSGKEQPQGAYQ